MAGKGTITAYIGSSSSIVPGGDGEQPTLKHPRKEGTSADTSGHVIGYNKSWDSKFPWRVPIYAEAESVSGMLCSLCKRHSTKNKYNRSTTWSGTPYVSLRKDCVRRHSKSEQHQGAVELKKILLSSREGWWYSSSSADGDIPSEKSCKGSAFTGLYILSEILHTTKYSSLVDAVHFMGCDYFMHLYQGEMQSTKA